MMLFITPYEIINLLPALLREKRVKAGMTQTDLANKSNVNIAVLRKFEQTGQISLESFIKLAYVLDLTDSILTVLKSDLSSSSSIDEIIKKSAQEKTKSGIKKRVRK